MAYHVLTYMPLRNYSFTHYSIIISYLFSLFLTILTAKQYTSHHTEETEAGLQRPLYLINTTYIMRKIL